jgi:hypothetical protein
MVTRTCLTIAFIGTAPFFCFLWRNTQFGPRLPHCWGFQITHNKTHTAGRTPLDKWSARRRDLYLTTLAIVRQPYPRQDSHPQPQKASGCRRTPETARPRVSAAKNLPTDRCFGFLLRACSEEAHRRIIALGPEQQAATASLQRPLGGPTAADEQTELPLRPVIDAGSSTVVLQGPLAVPYLSKNTETIKHNGHFHLIS